MARHPIDLIGGLSAPDGSGNVTTQLLAVVNSNDLWKGLALIFKDTATKDSFAFAFRVPANYVGTPQFEAAWLTTVTTGNVEWEVDYVCKADGETFDPSAFDRTVASGAVAVPGTARLGKVTTLSGTGADFAVGDWVFGHFSRKGTSGNDTAAADVAVTGLEFTYADA